MACLDDEDENTEDEEQDESFKETESLVDSPPNSVILGALIECVKSCHSRSFSLCLKILISLGKNNLLQKSQFFETLNQVNEVNTIIQNKRSNSSSPVVEKKDK